MTTYTYEEIVKMFGSELAEQALSSNAEPTSRLMHPGFEDPAHLDKIEYAGDPVSSPDGDTIQAFYYLSEEDEANMDYYDWQGNVEFQIL